MPQSYVRYPEFLHQQVHSTRHAADAMAYIARCDGARVYVRDIQSTLRLGNLQAQQVVAVLVSLELVQRARRAGMLNALTGHDDEFVELTPLGIQCAELWNMLPQARAG